MPAPSRLGKAVLVKADLSLMLSIDQHPLDFHEFTS